MHNDDLSTPVVPKIPTRGVYPFILFYFILFLPDFFFII
ncbi:putative membrane protein [Escherichia coli 3-373-03_S4_C2]|nr:putative membrane protein [Escherichia coli 3-373-03_S4_C2]